MADDQNRPLVDVKCAVDIFMSQNIIQPTTSFFLNVLKVNKPGQGYLLMSLLELNLVHAPQAADAIPGNEMLTRYDCWSISQKRGVLTFDP